MAGPYICYNVDEAFTNDSSIFILIPAVSYVSTSALAQIPASTPFPSLLRKYIDKDL